MKADVRSGIGREEYLLFSSLAAVSIREEVIVRATTAGSAASNGRIFFSFHRDISIGLVGLWSLFFLCFIFFSSLRTVSPISVPGFTYSGIASYLSWNTRKRTALGIHLGGIVFFLY